MSTQAYADDTEWAAQWTDWYLEHGEALYYAALGLARNPDDARDLVVDTLEKAMRADKNREGGYENLRSWLRRILIRTYIDNYRRERIRPTEPWPTTQDEDGPQFDPKDPGTPVDEKVIDQFTHEDNKTLILWLIEHTDLSPLQSKVLRIDFDFPDVADETKAEIIDSTAASVKNQRSRTVRKLRETAAKHGIDWPRPDEAIRTHEGEPWA